MKLFQFLLFLAALTGATSDLVFKKHVLINTPMIWSVAQDYCKQNYVDLSIIDTQQEFNRFTIQTALNASVRGWIGLSKNPSETRYTQWCDGTALSFRTWSTKEPSGIYEHCITTENNVWTDYYCNMTKPFFCYSEVIVVAEMKTWDEAQKHCRTYYTDLFSVTTQTDLTSSFWTGLRFVNGLWIWVNKEPAGMHSCPNRPFFCGAQNVGTKTWENRDCREKMLFVCLRQGSG